MPEKIVTNVVNNNPEDRVSNQPSQESHQQTASNCEFTSFSFDIWGKKYALNIGTKHQKSFKNQNPLRVSIQPIILQSD